MAGERGGRGAVSARSRVLVGLLAALVMLPALAHRLSPGYLGLNETAPGVFDVEWKVSISGGLADVLGPQFPPDCTVQGRVRAYAIDDASLSLGTVVCEGRLAGQPLGIAGLGSTDTDVLVRVDWLDGSSFTHRLVPTSSSVVVPERAGVGAVAWTYLVLGVEHILLGVDHLLFVLALLLMVRGFGRLVATVTAFTVAHSLTLGAAALGHADLPSAPVEATIALSILFLATELARRGAAGAAAGAAAPGLDLAGRFPWIVAFAFGLLHGFGFAGVLGEIGLPSHAVPLALLFFNIGVELGQIAFIAAVLGFAALWRRLSLPVPAEWARAVAYVIGIVAAYWAIERSASIFV